MLMKNNIIVLILLILIIYNQKKYIKEKMNCKKMKEYDEKIKYCLLNKKIKKIPDKYILNETKLNKHICNKCKTKINNKALNNICKNY